MNTEIQKLTGSFYTESKVAETIANWAIRYGNDRILEPSFGDGVFIEKSLCRYNSLGNEKPNITAVEIQSDIVENFREQINIETLNTVATDFLSLELDNQFNAVIGNPPYVGIKNLHTDQQTTARRIIEKHNAQCPNNGSLWFPFVLHAIGTIKSGGRLAFVLPFEITYARYAYGLWNILSQNFASLTISRIYEDFFPDVDVETILLFAEGKGGNTSRVNYDIYDTVNDFHNGKTKDNVQIPLSDIVNGKKPFIHTLLTAEQRQFFKRIKTQNIIEPIIESCKFKIGYVSADKNFFHPDAETMSWYRLPKENLIPTILNSKEVNGGTEIGIEANEGDCSSRLYVPHNVTAEDRFYIKNGESLGVHQRYKCRRRKPWYITPNIEIPDVILSVFGEMPKMIANNGKYAVSNSLLCGYLKNISAEQLLCRWYNSLTLLSLELNVHSLGGGSFVIIPGEADRLEIVKNIPQDKVSKIFGELDESAKNFGLEATYLLGDKLVLQDIFGLSDNDINTVRQAIQTLCAWRNPAKRRK